MIDTTITIAGISIHEPVTVFTDLIISAIAILFYFKLRNSKTQVIIHWGYFFLFFGISTFVGSCSHAFFLMHEGWMYKSFWIPMQLINGVAVYFAQQATLVSVLQNNASKSTWEKIYRFQLIAFMIAVPLFRNFLVTVIENALGLIPVMVLHYKYKEHYAKIIANGIAISFLTAIIHISKFSLHAYFNSNDIAHVFIMISLWVMYKGVNIKRKESIQR
ncbi:MAG TPA: hypothetical protein PLL00_04005 [Bacteroidia bacterium]|nr:hypothetical protein [Bacteroidia bacterium]